MYKFKIAQWQSTEDETADLVNQHRLCREYPEQIDWIYNQLKTSNIIQELFPRSNHYYNFSVTYWLEIEDEEEAMLYRLMWG